MNGVSRPIGGGMDILIHPLTYAKVRLIYPAIRGQ